MDAWEPGVDEWLWSNDALRAAVYLREARGARRMDPDLPDAWIDVLVTWHERVPTAGPLRLSLLTLNTMVRHDA